MSQPNKTKRSCLFNPIVRTNSIRKYYDNKSVIYYVLQYDKVNNLSPNRFDTKNMRRETKVGYNISDENKLGNISYRH